MAPDFAERLSAYHEAGHAVMAELCGRQVTEVEIIGDREQITPVPEPGTLALLGLGLARSRRLLRLLSDATPPDDLLADLRRGFAALAG